MSFTTKRLEIENVIRNLASKTRYNKVELLEKATSFLELETIRKQWSDKSIVEKIIAHMPETDFCKITEVEDCVAGKFQSCTCTKVMVFGEDKINSKICEKFTVRITSSKCKDGNFVLAGPCIASPLADSCDATLTSKEEISELHEQLAHAQNEIKAICSITGKCTKAYLSSFGIDEL
jgi:hypothetical protein